MKTYHIYKHSNGHMEAVKIGWSWPAFFFTYYWAFIKRLWIPGGTLIAINFILNLITDAAIYHFNEIISDLFVLMDFILFIIFMAFFGAKGNQLREENLIQNQYELIDTKMAPSPEAALSLFVPLYEYN